jgi:predicted amidohydrolase YtcJ
VHEAGIGPEEIDVFKMIADQGKLDLRVNAMLGEQEKPKFQVEDLVEYFRENRLESYANDLLCVKTVKLFFDGALGSRGAAFYEPYDDDPGNTGLLRIPPDYITEVALAALANDMSVATHCIGIRGNRLCLDAYEHALKSFPDKDHRLRIEHSQIVSEEDIVRFARLSIIPAMQPTHCTSDKDMVVDRVGEDRSEYAYAWRSFLDRGLPVPAGSDFPVESNDPLLGIYAAISRRAPGEPGLIGWHNDQCMTIEEAIKGFTIWAAYAAFQEDIIGSIEVGKYADFTILDKDITIIPPDEILNTRVVYTIMGGEIKYKTSQSH